MTPCRVPPIRRVLIVVWQTGEIVGGMETMCADFSAELVRRGIQVGVVLPEYAVFDELARRCRSDGATFVSRLDTRQVASRRDRVRRLRRLVQLGRAWGPDVVHVHSGGAAGGLPGVLASRLGMGATTIMTEHEVPVPQPPRHHKLERYVRDRLCHAVIAVSRHNAALRCQRLSTPPRFAAILNGVPLRESTPHERAANRLRVRQELGIASDTVVIGSLVRLSEGKGLDDLLRGFAIVVREQACTLVLVGDGPLRAQLESLSRELQLTEHVRFAGFHAEPSPFLDAFDVFVLPVPSGSMSIALLEAMLRGLPPVITFCGPEEAVINDETGLCAPPNNPAGLAAVLSRMVADGTLRERLGAAAEHHVRTHFSVQRVVGDHLELYVRARCGEVPERLRADQPPNSRPGDAWT